MCVQLDLISTLHHLVKSLPLEFATDRTLMNLSELRQIGKLFRPHNMKAPGAVAASKKKISQPVMLLLFGMLEKAGLGVLTTYKRNTLFKKTPLKTLGSVTATNMLMRFELGIQDFYSASGVDTHSWRRRLPVASGEVQAASGEAQAAAEWVVRRRRRQGGRRRMRQSRGICRDAARAGAAPFRGLRCRPSLPEVTAPSTHPASKRGNACEGTSRASHDLAIRSLPTQPACRESPASLSRDE